jgi:PLP dependent protein
MSTLVVANLERVHAAITAAAERSRRDPREITVVAVTKTFPVARIREALAVGLRDLGENRIQEAMPKIDAVGTAEARWHLIGHLQRNKVKFVEGRFAMVQSLDSRALVETLDRRLGSPVDVLVEVNVAEEPQKTGALPSDVDDIVRAIGDASHLRLQGLMTIAPIGRDRDAARPVFQRLAQMREALRQRFGMPLTHLSMGMTDDYPVAVEEGATMLRLGRALFGPR